MATKKKAAAKKAPAAKELARAAGSTDAGVHKLLADRQALTQSPEANPGAAEKIKAIDAELAEMGYSVS